MDTGCVLVKFEASAFSWFGSGVKEGKMVGEEVGYGVYVFVAVTVCCEVFDLKGVLLGSVVKVGSGVFVLLGEGVDVGDWLHISSNVTRSGGSPVPHTQASTSPSVISLVLVPCTE